MDNIILQSFAWIGLLGLIIGASLAVAAKYLAVKEDPRIGEVNELLPAANCGGCGYAGCAEYAKAIVMDHAEINLCAPGGTDCMNAIAAFMGVRATATEKMTAIVLCCGDDEVAKRRFAYNGINDCAAAHATAGGDKACTWGCLGYGSCARVCPVNAIRIEKGIAKVDKTLCIACEKCIAVCPRHLIKLVPAAAEIHVLCSSKDKGPAVKKACSTGCIGCRLCTKFGDEGAFVMDGFLAKVDYSIPITKEEVIEKCPAKCIVKD
ncbi:MAG: RnfABCDGE type electron transport complex subunit B [Kiritimatiellae bacterium]|jgi:electron transport complex protein RnfB|nr:RnfABCDGE type electron transport complex subunit B [Kiritimatiellia bacterium]